MIKTQDNIISKLIKRFGKAYRVLSYNGEALLMECTATDQTGIYSHNIVKIYDCVGAANKEAEKLNSNPRRF